MQGYIVKIIKSVREDLIVKVLTKNEYYTLYRFYGARHNIIYVGRKIDFEIQKDINFPKLRNIVHIPKQYELDINKAYVWHKFMVLLDMHLDKQLEEFYFNLLEFGTHLLTKQNPMRVICLLALELLDFEGRLYKDNKCSLCGEKLGEKIIISKGFICSCEKCILDPMNEFVILSRKLKDDFLNKSLINIDDLTIKNLYQIVLQGLH